MRQARTASRLSKPMPRESHRSGYWADPIKPSMAATGFAVERRALQNWVVQMSRDSGIDIVGGTAKLSGLLEVLSASSVSTPCPRQQLSKLSDPDSG